MANISVPSKSGKTVRFENVTAEQLNVLKYYCALIKNGYKTISILDSIKPQNKLTKTPITKTKSK